MHEDLDDTVIGSLHPRASGTKGMAGGIDGGIVEGIDEDTVVPGEPLSALVSDESETPSRPKPSAKREFAKREPVRQAAAVERTEDALPELVDPVTPTKQRRVPLTNKRLRDSLRTAPATPSPTSVASSLLAVQHPAPHSAHSFRIGDRAAVALDIPALVGRHPVAPRIPGRELPRLVRVSSPLREVSGTHLEVRQEGASVVVTDLRSTNGTIVRMPGARPLKLRQGESVVVRPGTLVDIGDGNVLEILPPPRLAVPLNPAAEERSWR